MLIDGANYAPSMTNFLNNFSKKSKRYGPADNQYYEQLFLSFLKATAALPNDAFVSERTNRFNVALFEAVFTAGLEDSLQSRDLATEPFDPDQIRALNNDPEFQQASLRGTTQTSNVRKRLARARALITGV